MSNASLRRDMFEILAGQLGGTESVLLEVLQERSRQDQLFPGQSWPILGHPSSAGYYAQKAENWKRHNDNRLIGEDRRGADMARDGILLEEVYEALAETDADKLRAELIQAAAVCVAIVEDLDRKQVKRQ